ncbi:MarR family winged helix-turn-helix transcriptional regulator [Actinomadura atramentaria]|uniref:MarR family winged helix-turn-helix transcriptional regulator n=1 Tax=Actinomadura atramentaria TaxID=1990 RepID=UPI00036E6C76|nr:MarR family winged helix-turn-helix transcriptional regulator [Actinomadura atramentaria]
MNDRPPEALLRIPTYLTVELVKLIRREIGDRAPTLWSGRDAAAARPPRDRVRWPHLLVLACLVSDGPTSQKRVSDRLRMDAADLVGIVDDLEAAGYAERRRDPADRRRHAVDATPEGRAFFHDDLGRRERFNDHLFAALTPAEVEQFRGLVLKVLAHHDPRFADTAGTAGT